MFFFHISTNIGYQPIYRISTFFTLKYRYWLKKIQYRSGSTSLYFSKISIYPSKLVGSCPTQLQGAGQFMPIKHLQ